MKRPRLEPLWQGIGAQLRYPSGRWGSLAGIAMARLNAAPNAKAIAALNLRGGETLLELGCGPGQALHAVLGTPHLARAIGLDWSETMLAQASRKNRLALEAGRLALVRGDFTRLPFADAAVDAILASNVVYFMASAAPLGEARRVLRPGGRIALYTTDRSAMRHWPFASRHTHRLFDCSRLMALLVEAGFARASIAIEAIPAGLGVKGLIAVAAKANDIC